jgi:hypothetical protein
MTHLRVLDFIALCPGLDATSFRNISRRSVHLRLAEWLSSLTEFSNQGYCKTSSTSTQSFLRTKMKLRIRVDVVNYANIILQHGNFAC